MMSSTGFEHSQVAAPPFKDGLSLAPVSKMASRLRRTHQRSERNLCVTGQRSERHLYVTNQSLERNLCVTDLSLERNLCVTNQRSERHLYETNQSFDMNLCVGFRCLGLVGNATQDTPSFIRLSGSKAVLTRLILVIRVQNITLLLVYIAWAATHV